MKKFVFFLLALLTLTFPFTITSCDGPDVPDTIPGGNTGNTQIDPNTVLTLNPTQFSITPGEQKRISVALNPQPSGAFNITWTSSNPAVATVASAVVTGVASGEATITATIEGTQISASVAVKVGTPIENAEFTNIQVIGYQTDEIPLSIKTYDLGENGDTIWKTVTDINEDGTDDYFIKAVAYIMPSTMTFESGTGVVGQPGYVICASTAIIFDGTYIYPFWNYTFSDDKEKYLTEELNAEGEQVTKWRYATYTHFNDYNYEKYYYKWISSNGAWPATQEERDAYLKENPYMGDRDSYLGYLMVPENSSSFITFAGLVSGGKGFTSDAGDQNKQTLTYLDVQLKFFNNFEYYCFEIQEDGEKSYYVTQGEGDDKRFKMAESVERTISFDNRKEAPKRAANQFKGIPMKRLEADRLTNVALMQILPRF
mgnify:CR=1 FL=1